jgi:hypothetical protein
MMIKRFLVFLLAMGTAFACKEDELSFSLTPSVGFLNTNGTLLEDNEAGVRVQLYTNKPVTEAVTVTIQFINFQNLEYGVDFTTDPELINNEITVLIDPTTTDNVLPSFFVYPTFNGKDRQLAFEIKDVSGGNFLLGQPSTLSYLLRIKSLGCPFEAQNVNVIHDFNGCADFATPTGFIEAFEPGSKTDRGWGCRAFGLNSTRAVRASAFGGAAGDDKAWLIMNPVRIAKDAEVTLHFWVNSSFIGPGTISVKWSSDYAGSGNPLVATWQNLSSINSQLPAAGSAQWKEVQATLTDICGENVYFAFQFTGATNSESASWDIDNLQLTVQ